MIAFSCRDELNSWILNNVGRNFPLLLVAIRITNSSKQNEKGLLYSGMVDYMQIVKLIFFSGFDDENSYKRFINDQWNTTVLMLQLEYDHF